MKYKKEKCPSCFKHDIIMITEPEDMNRPCFIYRSCNHQFTVGKTGYEYAEYVINRQENKKKHENFIFKTFEEYNKKII